MLYSHLHIRVDMSGVHGHSPQHMYISRRPMTCVYTYIYVHRTHRCRRDYMTACTQCPTRTDCYLHTYWLFSACKWKWCDNTESQTVRLNDWSQHYWEMQRHSKITDDTHIQVQCVHQYFLSLSKLWAMTWYTPTMTSDPFSPTVHVIKWVHGIVTTPRQLNYSSTTTKI